MRHLHPGFGKFVLSALALVVLLAASILASPATPVAQAQSGNSLTSLILQNLDPLFPMNAKLTYFDANGQILLTSLKTVSPSRSITVTQSSEAGLPTNFSGTASFDSDTPFGAVVMEYNGGCVRGRRIRL